MPADLFDDRADEGRFGVGFEPALGAAPIDQLDAGQRQARRVRRQGEAPEGPIFIEEAQPMFVQVLPVRSVQSLAAQTVVGRGHRAFATFKSQVQALAIVARGSDRQRLLPPFRQALQGTLGVHLKLMLKVCRGFGRTLRDTSVTTPSEP